MQRPSGERARNLLSRTAIRGQHQVHPAGQRHIALAAPQRLTGVVQRHQRRGTRAVHDLARRPHQPEGVRDPPGGERGLADQLVAVDVADVADLLGAPARSRSSRGRRTRPCYCPSSACPGAYPARQAPPRPPEGPSAAGGPCPPPHAARSRRLRAQSGRPRRGSRHGSRMPCPESRGPDRSTSRPRPERRGNSLVASTPSTSSRQKPSGSATPPGIRQPRPMIATGSATRRPAAAFSWLMRRSASESRRRVSTEDSGGADE